MLPSTSGESNSEQTEVGEPVIHFVSEEGMCHKSEPGAAWLCVPALLQRWKLIFLGIFFPGGCYLLSSTQTSSFNSTGSSHWYSREAHSRLVEGVARTPWESSVSTSGCQHLSPPFPLSRSPVSKMTFVFGRDLRMIWFGDDPFPECLSSLRCRKD